MIFPSLWQRPAKTDWRGKDLLWLTVSKGSWGAGSICFRLAVRQNIMAAGPQAGEAAHLRRATENIGRAWIRASIRACSQWSSSSNQARLLISTPLHQ